MKFMLMLNTPRDGCAKYMSWPKEIRGAKAPFVIEFNRELSAAGELVGAEGLASPVQAKLVRAGKDGRPITDGVFPEAKEFLAGYWIVDVDGPERAYQLAAEASTAPGIGDEPLWVEVGGIMSGRQDLE